MSCECVRLCVSVCVRAPCLRDYDVIGGQEKQLLQPPELVRPNWPSDTMFETLWGWKKIPKD